jgi:hypothetical protein
LQTDYIHRDPWWIFTTINLFWNIKCRYDFGVVELIRVSPRFGILLLSMSLSVGFIIVDILSVTPVLTVGLPNGINPFWKFAFVFKCFTDTIILDDFKTALDRLKQYNLQKLDRDGCPVNNGNGIDVEWAASQRETELAPWNESTGDTPAGEPKVKPPTNNMNHIDLEMNYCTEDRGESSESRKD